MMFSTPEYAGALPGSFKNLLDWTIGDDQPGSIYHKPVGWINASPRGGARARVVAEGARICHRHDCVDTACVESPVTSAMIGDDGCIADPSARE